MYTIQVSYNGTTWATFDTHPEQEAALALWREAADMMSNGTERVIDDEGREVVSITQTEGSHEH